MSLMLMKTHLPQKYKYPQKFDQIKSNKNPVQKVLLFNINFR